MGLNRLRVIFQNIADAIKEKSGEYENMSPSEMPDKIKNLPGSSGDSSQVSMYYFKVPDGEVSEDAMNLFVSSLEMNVFTSMKLYDNNMQADIITLASTSAINWDGFDFGYNMAGFALYPVYMDPPMVNRPHPQGWILYIEQLEAVGFIPISEAEYQNRLHSKHHEDVHNNT